MRAGNRLRRYRYCVGDDLWSCRHSYESGLVIVDLTRYCSSTGVLSTTFGIVSRCRPLGCDCALESSGHDLGDGPRRGWADS